MVLRRLTIRVLFTQVASIPFGPLPISTIASPVFSEFVLELGGLNSHPSWLPPEDWGSWEEIDEFLNGQFTNRGGFKLIIRTDELHDPTTFQRHATDAFPLLASRGCIRFETTPLIEKHWP